MLLLIKKKHADTLIEQTRNHPQEALDFEINGQMETFAFNPQIIFQTKEKGN